MTAKEICAASPPSPSGSSGTKNTAKTTATALRKIFSCRRSEPRERRVRTITDASDPIAARKKRSSADEFERVGHAACAGNPERIRPRGRNVLVHRSGADRHRDRRKRDCSTRRPADNPPAPRGRKTRREEQRHERRDKDEARHEQHVAHERQNLRSR